MNNWRLLLLAVVAVLQPIGSFTERNLIDGREECCDHPPNSPTQDTRLHGTYRKTTPEEYRLSTREVIREERRDEARRDPITRSRESLSLERAERRVSSERTVRFSGETRFARDQERRQPSIGARESRQSRDNSRRTREIVSGDTSSRRERNVIDSIHARMSGDDTRIGNERLYSESLGSQDTRKVRNNENARRVSPNRETMAVLRRKRDDVAHDVVRRESRIITLRSVDTSRPDNNRERRSLDQRVKDNKNENRRSRSQHSRVTRVHSREDQRSNFRAISEVADARKQRDQYRETRELTDAVRTDRIPATRRRESRDTIQRSDRAIRETRENHNNEQIDERRKQRDENRLPQKRFSKLQESRLGSTGEGRHFTRESRNSNVRMESIVRTIEERDSSVDVLRASLDSTTERRENSRISRVLEATSRNERLVKSGDIKDGRRQPLARSLDRISVMRSSPEESNSRDSTRFLKRNVRDEKAVIYRRDVRSVERIARDQTISTLRDSRENERSQDSRRESLSRFDVSARSERESIIRGELRSNERFDVSRREREERRAFREHPLDHMVRETERRNKHAMTRMSLSTEQVDSDERLSRNSYQERENIRSGQIYARRVVSDENRGYRVRTIVQDRLTRDVSAPQRRHDTRRISRIADTNTKLRITRSLYNRRDMLKRDEDKATRDTIHGSRESRERNQEQRREIRATMRDSRDIQNEGIRTRGDIRMGERFEIRRQRDESRSSKDRIYMQRQTRDSLAARSVERRSRELASQNDAEMTVRSEKLSRNRNVRINEGRNNQDFRGLESRRGSRRMTEKEVHSYRQKLAMESMDRTTNPASREERIEDKLKSNELSRDAHTDARRVASDTRFRNFDSRGFNREILIDHAEDKSENQNSINWQMVFYTLQGAYLCGLLMQMVTEKSNKGKSRNLVWWASSKNLVKVD